jgi:putative nucleotidyltransferase with HDIG domain
VTAQTLDSTHTAIDAAPARSAALTMYVHIVIAVGGAAVIASLLALRDAPHPLQWVLFGLLAVVIGRFNITIDSIDASISVADTFFITTALLFGPAPAAVAMAADSLVLSWRKHHRWTQIAFNTVAPALSMWVASRAFFLMAGVGPLSESHAPTSPLIAPLLCMAVIYFALNSGLMATAVALEARQSPVQIWRRHFLWLGVGYCASASVAFCLLLLIQQVSLGAVALILPVLAVFYLTLQASFGRLEDARRHLAKVDRLYLSTVETLAMAIDAKDDVTHSHVRRVQAYAMGLARALGIDDEATLKAIEAAALLHDTGKLAVPEHILNKPGGLTAPEFDQMKLHVDVGADILSLVEFPYPVVPIVRCHHESWDGSGYPRGVKGEAIPIGARILSVADCFDALTSDRPYRRRMTDEAALDILRERSGRMYDPRVVARFIEIYRDVVVVGDAPEQRDVLAQIRRSTKSEPAAALLPAPASVLAASVAASDDVLAFVSVARLAAGDVSLRDVLALSANLIRNIVPAASGAWYVPDAARGELVAVEAFGPAAPVLRGAGVKTGDRLTGWVAANRQVILNSDAALDLGDRASQLAPALDSCMSVPLMAGESMVAVLSLYAAGRDVFTEDLSRLVQMIAPHAARAIAAANESESAARDAAAGAEKARTTARELRLVAAR